MPPSLRLLPQTIRFFDLFRRSGDHVREGAALLLDMLESGEDVQRRARRLKDIEHAADENTHEIFAGLNATFVTPLDREDIAELASALDDVIDWTEEASRRLSLYGLEQAPALAKQLARVLVDQSAEIVQGLDLLGSRKDGSALERATREIHRLENEADDIFAEVLAHLYDGVTDIPGLITAMRWGDIYQVLEGATDKAEHVAVVLRNIALKHA
jgi:predicted phosphate transport protein (TIGR00153 family)